MDRVISTTKPTIVLAGPGAGKTHGMANEIVAALDGLQPHRHLAAITYTNAAANTIRERLSDLISNQRNVFIGTTHAFLNRFILQPFATIFDELPEERIYGAIDVTSIATKEGTKKLVPKELNIAKAGITKKLVGKGVVPYDAMISIAERLLKQKMIREKISYRLQFLFIDEFQDTDTRQFKLFEEIRKGKHTKIYAVGDTEQYVTGFTYGMRGQKIPDFNQIPFHTFLEKSTKSENLQNRRANGELIEFANKFRSDTLRQISVKPYRDKQCVFFINTNSIEPSIESFKIISEDIEREEDILSRLYLGFKNDTFDSVREKFGITPISNDSCKVKTVLCNALELISWTVGLSQRCAREKFNLTLLEWRFIGIKILRRCQSQGFNSDQLLEFVTQYFSDVTSASRKNAIQENLEQIKNILITGIHPYASERCSSIHKAKGLEADAVLVVARTTNELRKWLTTDPITRCADKNDTCRLGYVAITRPRELLCFTCLKPLDDETWHFLSDLGVTIV
ncbi:UvrD-helicase domain-containing protein [Desulfobulbus sp. F5]|nr:UvrD-helicase domain-containing protein [Desulfobulbus sp. F5]